MTGAAIASAGMSVVGGIGARNDAKDAQRSSDAANERSNQYQDQAIGVIEENQATVDALQTFLTSMGEEGMTHAQGLLDNWESTFGGVQENLSSFYNNLDPTKYATESKATLKRNMDKQMEQFNDTMASSGLQSSGMKQQAAKEAAFKTAEANSQIDLASEDKVAEMKQGWLNQGEPQRAFAQSNMSQAQRNQALYGETGFNAQSTQNTNLANAYLGGSEFQQNQSANYGASAAGYNQSAGNMFGSAMRSGITAYDGLTGGSGSGLGGGVQGGSGVWQGGIFK